MKSSSAQLCYVNTSILEDNVKCNGRESTQTTEDGWQSNKESDRTAQIHNKNEGGGSGEEPPLPPIIWAA